ncbi:DUF3592 domain-containing protein [Acidicapsa acidisoli]|uniref:DUF3592 domain-containing protein n=1 Tax=Acidicapsa acidisoli TaxID=1615681 RepID=UPI0021DF7E6C|nr:DUF3592 domain-containing protein [Acidicapsa acidisoli]
MDWMASTNTGASVPSELTQPVPRKVRLNSSPDAKFALTLVVVFFAGGLITIGWLCYNNIIGFQQRAILRSNGRVVIGEVTGFSIVRFAPIGVNYRFSVNGVHYSGKAKVPPDGTSLDKADKIPIRFLPTNPTINHPDTWEWSVAIGGFYTAIEIFFTSLGALVFAFIWRERQLAREGNAAGGVVTSCKLTDRRYEVEYQFCTEDGTTMKGKSDCADEYGAGARIWVLYLPRKPMRNHPYPMDLFEVVE